MRLNQSGSSLIYMILFAGVMGAMAYNLQSFMSDQVAMTRQSVIIETKNAIKKEIEILMTYPGFCNEYLKVSENRFTIGPLFSIGTSYRQMLRLTDLKLVNEEKAMFGFVEVDLQFSFELLNAKGLKQDWQMSRRVTYKPADDGKVESCLAVPNAKTECEKLGTKMIGNRCSICETIGGTWDKSECLI